MGVKAGDTGVIGGVGFIAMGHVIAALYRNANVIALARNPYRIDLLRKMGVKHIIDPDAPDWREHVMALTYRGEGADFAVDGSGVTYYQERLMSCLRKYGQMNFSGHTPGASIELSALHHVLDPARTIFGQHDVRMIDREGLVRSLLDERVQQMIDVMVTHEFPLSQANEAFKLQASKQCGKIYLMMD
jgi:threonine 3-dehydrogenase